MSVQSCTAFLERAQADPGLGEMLRALTDTRELIALGQRNGYSFDVEDLVTASSALPAQDETPPEPTPATTVTATAEPTILHYELDLRAVPEMKPVLDELPNLTIKPTTVDLGRFGAAFRRDDLDWTTMSPAAAGFRERYDDIMARHWTGTIDDEYSRRDFHLVNLDEHVDDPLYDHYLQAKLRTIRHFSHIFACDIQFSGSMWYPPFSYRLWHTNETQPGWRMYLIDFDATIPESDTRSFFRYMNPQTKELVTLQDRPKLLRFFKVDQGDGRLFWHCIVNAAERHRWSFGFVIPDDWLDRLQAAVTFDAIPSINHGGGPR